MTLMFLATDLVTVLTLVSEYLECGGLFLTRAEKKKASGNQVLGGLLLTTKRYCFLEPLATGQ